MIDTDVVPQRAIQTWAAAADREARTELLHALYRLRREQRPRLTQAAVAERMGISQATVSAFESRKAVPRLATLQRYARAIGVRLVLQLDHTPPTEEFADEIAEATSHSEQAGVDFEDLTAEAITDGSRQPATANR